MSKSKFNLNLDYRIEPILLSLNDNNYKPIIEQLSIEIEPYDKDLKTKLDRYLWIADNQLGGKSLHKGLLKQEFPGFILDDYQPIPSDNLSDYIKIFITQKRQRSVSSSLSLIADDIRTQGLTPELVEKIYQCTSISSSSDNEFVNIADTFKDIYDKKSEVKGLSFLCPALDKLTGGIQKGTLCTILGGPGSMKTTYSMNIAYEAARNSKNTVYLSLEESSFALYSKLLSRASVDVGKQLQAQDIVQNKLEEQDKKILYDSVEPYLTGLPGKIYIVDEQSLPNYNLTTFESLFKEIDKLAIKETGHGIDLVVVDHIQLLKFAASGYSEYSAINMYVSFFRQQCLSWLHENREVSIILLSQANREGIAYAQKHHGQYLMQHVAEASEVERASSYIISVYTDGMAQITKLLTLSAIKLRGSQLPLDVINIFADGSFYQVGDTSIPEQSEYSASDVFNDTSSNNIDVEDNDAEMEDYLEGIVWLIVQQISKN